MILTAQEENQLNFINDEISQMIGGIDFLITAEVENVTDSHTALLVSDELKGARSALLRARKFNRNLLDGYYQTLIENAKHR